MMIPRIFYGVAAALPLVAAADEVQMKAECVALFSNGYSQVSLSGELPEGKLLEIKGMPAPVEGTLWWSLPQGVKVVQMEGSIREREIADSKYEPLELLAANIGKKVRLRMEDGRVYEGVPERQQLPPKAELTYTNHSGSVRQQQLSQQAPIFLKTHEGEYVDINTKTLQSIEFAELPTTPSRKELQPRLVMELQQAAPGGSFRLDCLAQGLSWKPTYRIDLRGEDKAAVACKAIIVNDMVDLQNTRLELVAGQPELGSDGLPLSPLSCLRQMDSNVYKAKSRAQMVPAPVAMAEANESDDEAASGVEGIMRTEELYRYSIPDFSAKKNSAVAREIFSQEVECHHVYTCRLSSRSDEGEVMNCLRLKNETSWLWSSGTVVCYADGRLLARTELRPTAAGQHVLLPLAVTQDITVRQSQTKLKTEPLTVHRSKDEDDDDAFAAKKATKISTFEGKIMLKNHADHAVDMELSNRVTGTVTAASHDGEINVSPTYSENHDSRILWKCHLEPGEERTLTYTYEHKSN